MTQIAKVQVIMVGPAKSQYQDLEMYMKYRDEKNRFSESTVKTEAVAAETSLTRIFSVIQTNPQNALPETAKPIINNPMRP